MKIYYWNLLVLLELNLNFNYEYHSIYMNNKYIIRNIVSLTQFLSSIECTQIFFEG